MNGKSKCRVLKEIRREIARNNDIEFITSDCTFQGECTGTCPKCEAEVRYLEQELAKRRRAGKAVAVAGIAASLVVTATGCSAFDFFQNAVSPPRGSAADVQYPLPETKPASGSPSENTSEQAEWMGEPVAPPEDNTASQGKQIIEILGDVAYVPDVESSTTLLPGEVPDPT